MSKWHVNKTLEVTKMVSNIPNGHMEGIAIGMAEHIYKNPERYKKDDIIEAIRSRDEKFNFSQINMIAFRISVILKMIHTLEEKEIQGNITEVALGNFCKNNKLDIHTLKVATEIIFGKRKKGKIYAFLK